MKQIIAAGKLYIVCNVCKYKQGWLLKFAKILFCISYKQFHYVEFLQFVRRIHWMLHCKIHTFFNLTYCWQSRIMNKVGGSVFWWSMHPPIIQCCVGGGGGCKSWIDRQIIPRKES